MQTPAILNISSPAASPASANRAASAPDNTFNQMLSQQVAERRDAAKAAQPRAADKPVKNEAKQADVQKQPGAAKPQEGKPASANGEAKETTASDQEQQEQTADAAAIPPTATELLAQLAGVTLQTQTQSPAEASATAVDAAATGDTAPLQGKHILLTAAEPGMQKEQVPAEGKQVEFGANLQEAGQRQAVAQHADMDSADITAAQDGNTRKAADKLVELPAAAKLPEAPIINAAAQLQTGSIDAMQAAAGKVAERLTPHVGTPAWDQALGQKVVWMVAGAQQSASLTLNPPDLGPLQVVLNVSNGQADASFYAAQPEVRQALESALPKLRDMLDQAGVALGQASVSAGMPDQHNEPSSQASQQASRGNANTNNSDEAATQVSRPVTTASGRGLVDAYA